MNTATLIGIALSVLALNIRTTLQQQCVTNLDLILAIDGSNSMGGENFKKQLTSVENLLRPMNVSEDEIHVGLILFSGDIRDTVPLSGNKNLAMSELRSLNYPDEETRTDLAIDTAVYMFSQFGRNGSVPKLLMIVTDGVPTKPTETIASANRAKDLGINIFVIAVTERADVNEMKKIASVKNRDEYQVFVTANFNTLEASLNNATYRACVDLKCQDARIDIVFVMDSSSTTNATNFQEMKTFVHEFLQFADVDGEKIRVAIVTYSDTANVQFYLNTYNTKVLMNNAINSLQYRPGGANLVDALKLLRTNVFTRNSGDRSDVNNVVILLSANDVGVNLALASEEADATRAAGIQIFGVGIGQRSSNLMDNVVSRPQGNNSFMIDTFAQLRPLIPEVYIKFNRFCDNPPPVPACKMGKTDIWYVVDVSQTAERLSRFQFTGDFYWLKNGLTKMIEIAQDPSVPNPGVRLGMTAYSDSSRLISDASQFDSVDSTARAVQQLPAGIAQGGAALVSALQNIVAPAVVSDYRSYVTVVAPESSYVSSVTSLETELTRLKGLGYTVVVIVVTESGSLDQQALQRYASGPRFVYNIARYSDLEAATKNLTRDRICNGLKDNSTGLCAESGHTENGVGVVAHPMDCDKYIQCYYNQRGELDLGVVRQCPMGLHFNSASKICSKPDQARCAYDRCQESCQQYKMSGSCRAFWDCEDGKSTPQCCPENYAFVQGKGCQPDASCKDLCGPFKSCSMCQKKPAWDNRAGYDVRIFSGNMWIPRPCFHDDFNILDCGCTAPRDQACPADRVFDFTDVQTLRAIDEGRKEGIRVYDVQKVSGGVVLANRSAVHVSVNHMEGGNEPFALEFRFRELDAFSPYGETLVSSGFTCGNANSLHISADDQFIFAEIRSSRGQLAEVKVPTKGLNKEEFKDLVSSYDTGVLSLSIKDEKTQYIAKTEAPSNICLACGLDIGRGLNKLSFDGEIQKIAVYSCAWPLLY